MLWWSDTHRHHGNAQSDGDDKHRHRDHHDANERFFVRDSNFLIRYLYAESHYYRNRVYFRLENNDRNGGNLIIFS